MSQSSLISHTSSRNLTHVDVSGMRFDVYRSLYPVDPSTIVHLTRMILLLPLLQRYTARDVMRGHPSSSCSAAACAVMQLLMATPSPHPRLELVDLSANGARHPALVSFKRVCRRGLSDSHFACDTRCPGVVLSPRMCTMMACVQFFYYGRISARLNMFPMAFQ